MEKENEGKKNEMDESAIGNPEKPEISEESKMASSGKTDEESEGKNNGMSENAMRNPESPVTSEENKMTDLNSIVMRMNKEEDAKESADKGIELTAVEEATVISIDATDRRAQIKRERQNNTYAAKKTVAQGMMDIALITANANQLRYIVEYQRNSPTFYVNITLIVISLLLQIAVGVSLIFKGRFDMRGESKSAHARKINNYVVVGVFMVTIINVFVAAFSVSPTAPPTSPPAPPTG